MRRGNRYGEISGYIGVWLGGFLGLYGSEYQKSGVAIFSTGSELQGIRSELKPGMIYDSNGFTLSFRAIEFEYCNEQDDMVVLTDAIKAAIAECDFLITTGGVSVGKRDYLQVVCKQIGVRMLFEGVAAKPGSPVHAYFFLWRRSLV